MVAPSLPPLKVPHASPEVVWTKVKHELFPSFVTLTAGVLVSGDETTKLVIVPTEVIADCAA